VAAADGDRSLGTLRLGEAQDALAAAAAVVARRHGDRHDADLRLVENNGNPTLYQYGYLRFASDLCFWKRELVMADNAVTGATATPPGCFFP